MVFLLKFENFLLIYLRYIFYQICDLKYFLPVCDFFILLTVPFEEQILLILMKSISFSLMDHAFDVMSMKYLP